LSLAGCACIAHRYRSIPERCPKIDSFLGPENSASNGVCQANNRADSWYNAENTLYGSHACAQKGAPLFELRSCAVGQEFCPKIRAEIRRQISGKRSDA
jgi:hypothetical protein